MKCVCSVLTFLSLPAWFYFSRWAPAALSSGLHLLLQSDGGDAGPAEWPGLPPSCWRQQPVPLDHFHPETPQIWRWELCPVIIFNGIITSSPLLEATWWEGGNCTQLLHTPPTPSPKFAAMSDSWLKNLFKISRCTVSLRWSDICATKLTLAAKSAAQHTYCRDPSMIHIYV